MTRNSRGVWIGLVVAAALGWAPLAIHELEDFTSTLSGWGYVTRGLYVLRSVINPGSLVSPVVLVLVSGMSESRRYVTAIVTESVANMAMFAGTWLVLKVKTRFSDALRGALLFLWAGWVLWSLCMGLFGAMWMTGIGNRTNRSQDRSQVTSGRFNQCQSRLA